MPLHKQALHTLHAFGSRALQFRPVRHTGCDGVWRIGTAGPGEQMTWPQTDDPLAAWRRYECRTRAGGAMCTGSGLCCGAPVRACTRDQEDDPLRYVPPSPLPLPSPLLPAGDKFLDLDESTSDDDVQVVDGAAGLSQLGYHGYVPGGVSQPQPAGGRPGPLPRPVSGKKSMPEHGRDRSRACSTAHAPHRSYVGLVGPDSSRCPWATGVLRGAGCGVGWPVSLYPMPACLAAQGGTTAASGAAGRQKRKARGVEVADGSSRKVCETS